MQCVCVCACTCACVHVCVHMSCMHAYMHVCMHVCTCMRACMCASSMHACMHTCTYMLACMCYIHVCMRVCLCVICILLFDGLVSMSLGINLASCCTAIDLLHGDVTFGYFCIRLFSLRHVGRLKCITVIKRKALLVSLFTNASDYSSETTKFVRYKHIDLSMQVLLE